MTYCRYKVDDVLANIIAQTSGYKQDIDELGLDTAILGEMIEYLVNEVSKLKSILLEIPKQEDIQ